METTAKIFLVTSQYKLRYKVTSKNSTLHQRVEREERIMKKWKGLRTCFTCMCPGVGLKVVWPWKLSLTGFTLEWLNAYTHNNRNTQVWSHTHKHAQEQNEAQARDAVPKCVSKKKIKYVRPREFCLFHHTSANTRTKCVWLRNS